MDLSQEQASVVERITQAFADEPGALLPILRGIQDALGWVPDAAVAPVAQALNLSRAEVHGVLTFYHDFKRKPPAGVCVRVCAAEACQAVGARAVQQAVDAVIATGANFESVPVYCLGNCALGPNVMVDGRVLGRVDASAVGELLTG